VENLLTLEPFRRGLDLFNRREFFECHEVWEDLWRPSRGPERLFLQALIHFAVGFYHHQRSNPQGAARQLRKGLRKLAGYLPEFEGIETALLYREGQDCLQQIISGLPLADYPRIEC